MEAGRDPRDLADVRASGVTDAVEGQPGLGPGDLAGLACVQRWLQAHGAFWGETSAASEVQRKLEVLAGFCGFCDQAPDELVDSLFRQTPEGPRIKLKRRRAVMAQIDEFEREFGKGNVTVGREAGNVVRSFLIHNGVALTATPLRW
jgi:hypothetical protein